LKEGEGGTESRESPFLKKKVLLHGVQRVKEGHSDQRNELRGKKKSPKKRKPGRKKKKKNTISGTERGGKNLYRKIRFRGKE